MLDRDLGHRRNAAGQGGRSHQGRERDREALGRTVGALGGPEGQGRPLCASGGGGTPHPFEIVAPRGSCTGLCVELPAHAADAAPPSPLPPARGRRPAGRVRGGTILGLLSYPEPYAGPVPDARCAPGALPESTQGRVPKSEVDSGRAAKGYRCNTVLVSHSGESGGYHVWRYADRRGHVCAYYDSTLLLGRDGMSIVHRGPGTVVLDMTDPAHPVQTDVLSTPGMDQPHESLRLNARRGLLVAVAGSPGTAPGVLDVYDVTADCRKPVLRSSTPTGLLGHESGFSPDGRTYRASSYLNGHGTLTAIDLTQPALPRILLLDSTWVLHGLSVSDDGNRLYAADQSSKPGFRVFDVSDVQARPANPRVRLLSFLTWPQVSIPQYAEAVTMGGRRYAIEVDEFASSTTRQVGAGRLIDLSSERTPKVVSNVRLAVNQPAALAGAERGDLGAQAVAEGYAGHYCSVPTRDNPHLMACSFILSGLRLFDIRNPRRPVEVGYFNVPMTPTADLDPVTRAGAFAMSQPAWDVRHDQVWYSDGNKASTHCA